MSNPYYGGAPPGGDPNQPQYGHGTPQQQFAGAGYQQNLYGQPPNPAYGQPSPGIPPPPQSGPYSPAGGPPGMGLPSPGGYLGQPGYGVDAMTAQMGQMGVQDPHGVPPLTPGAGPPPPGAAAHRSTRKKQRAYHELDQAPAVQPAPPIVPSPNAGLYSGTQPPQPQFASPTTASPPQFASSQFVTPANAGLQPANQPANIAEYGANMRGPGGNGRVDPDSIPSVPASRQAATLHYKTTVYPTVEQHLPPPAATDFIAIDQGNSSPKYIRLTLNTIPTTAELLNSTALPLGLTIQPLAAQKPEELPVPVLDFGDEGPPRCRRCRTYINPFMAFSANGAKFVCNMCSFPNEVPSTYYSPLDMTGKRVDREQRPELMRGTVEFTVPKEYWEKEPTPLRWLFALDVSMEAVNKGLIASTCRAIQRAIYGEEGEENSDENVETARKLPKGAKIAILTYDKEVHFYNLSANLDQAQMLVMTDLEDPFVPLSEGLFVDPYQSEKVIKSLLSSLPNLFANIKNAEPALLPTLTAALTALEGSGGKIVCSLSALPTWGPGRLHYREDSKMLGSDKERALFSTEHQSWKKLAKQMAENNVGIDFFVTPSAYIDVAAVGHLSAVTGGELFFYPNFTAERDSPKLEQELIHTVHRETGYQALMKVRCSNGLQVSAYHGNFLLGKQGGDINLSVIDQDKAFAVTFVYDGKLDPKLDAHFQSALLYTTATGERRVRCHNICAAVTEVAKEGLRFVDQDAVITALAKEAADMMVHKPLQTVRGFLTEKCVDILAAYRKNFSGGSPPGQLVLPEALKEFGLYILCLLKTRAFRGMSDIWHIRRLLTGA